ncbi:hypothetical protein PSN45_000917 [Yamadazyma tenuis]|uniref:UPF0029-domain-containing protein n=1 Tax=Candida tenuis (strain ATCC 10573 / BCRC 21748 / CBS 615 / JCM 9827 / NBRC 10315 / NRRL Y-1498 / VKM Y-70) TaxID=590646 RepID=G3BBN8_CANTC|nr:UPF0029-domain-containing protein [Yamadazyma tenuis ATCC 10573]EGV62197.1 UPF0029-domain-containing protein [Yamadazyma tenuis ATCC 10573]WEJ93454.1 hypothetical protein PSN45_000917 [Yamadazyma tenuis]
MTVEELQDEICATDAIFPDCTTEVAPQIYTFMVPSHSDLEIQVSFPESYPDEIPSLVQVIVHDQVKYSDEAYLERAVKSKLEALFSPGCVVVIELLSELEVFLESYNDRITELEDQAKMLNIKEESEEPEVAEIEHHYEPQADPLEGWVQSDAVVDRGSTFIGFAKEVHSLEEAETAIDLLVTEKKISKASHNMTAWRIKGEGGVQYQDCDDDGESAAGSRILHLLTMMDLWNVVVVVSRWFGGTHIGPDRFKHINSAARDAIVKGGFGATNTGKEQKKSKKKK